MLVLIIAIVSLILQLFLPWWIISPIAFGLSFLMAKSGKQAFGSAFLAILLLWIGMGLIHTLPNENILANRVGSMLNLPDTSLKWIIVLLLTGIIGGLAAGFSGLSGYYVKEAVRKS
ncbi:MAG: hypothetical protein Q8S11_11140 [Daejeonella sp.]|uniref:hypothetical protein n=1 Tax=Daejeonella sp. TaxID=2805397 RepID=UPI002736BE4D|nr:hypothetical protein [Daejeonella sp.]MDP3468881.1 hypothetical protein [Daejeonella sp.]